MRFLRHALIRRKCGLHRTPLQAFRLKVARTAEDYRAAFRLLQVGYVFQGLEPVSGRTLRITEHHVLNESTVVLAYEGDQVVGTMTVTLDSPAGLPLDGDYPDELAAFRRAGGRLAELGSFAIVRRCWRSGVAQTLGLACVQLALRQGAQRFVIGVHPRAGELYSALYGFQSFGRVKTHETLQAPVLALELTRDRLRAHLTRHYGPMTSGHLPVEHVFDGVALPCFPLPRDVRSRRFRRSKMETDVFRQVFSQDSDRLETLGPKVREHLSQSRSLNTLSAA